ncbi:MAG: 3-deoxy-7-phosphoheptulonate synthase, partial [Oscillospiraceae bacterium]|nr:3-deoxy-7-phosphoheptulonate synthase [Oscillospiraceae bacterium]
MILVLKRDPGQERLETLISWLEGMGVTTHLSRGEYQTILGLVGDTSNLDIDLIKSIDIVEDAKRVSEPYKNANRKFHP